MLAKRKRARTVQPGQIDEIELAMPVVVRVLLGNLLNDRLRPVDSIPAQFV